MKTSDTLTILASSLFTAGIILTAIGISFCLTALGTTGPALMLDIMIGLSVSILGILFILATFRIADRVKKARKKILSVLILFLIFAAPSHALNTLEKFIYKKDVMYSNGTKVLVNRLTGEVKYICRDNGQDVPLEGQWKEQYQKMYDAQNGSKKQ